MNMHVIPTAHLLMRRPLLTLVILCSVLPAQGAVLYVDGDAGGANDGSSWADAYVDLQSAISAAVAGDEIWVAAGTYTPAGPDGDREATFQLNSGVGLYGGFSGIEEERDQRDHLAYPTVLSGDLNGDDQTVSQPPALADAVSRLDNSLHVVTGTAADDTALLDGFTIRGGYADRSGTLSRGGGMINMGPTAGDPEPGPMLIDCTFEGNFALQDGGGLYNSRSNLTLIGCTFRQNHAEVEGWAGAFEEAAGVGGAGIYSQQSDFVLIDCTLSDNTSNGQGGAILNQYRSPVLIGCQFVNNQVFGTGVRHSGGAIWTRELGTPTLINCVFLGNRAQAGGGMLGVHDSDPTLVNCLFSGNVGVGAAGYAAGFAINTANATLINCTLSGNINEGPGQAGAGVYAANQNYLDIANCIIWGNSANGVFGRTSQIAPGAQIPNINHSCVQGGWDGGIGNIDLDPGFMDADGADDIVGTLDDDLRIGFESPCAEAGDATALPLDWADLDGDGDITEPVPMDLDGDVRVYGIDIDMGAYEVGLSPRAVNPQPAYGTQDVYRDAVLSWESGVFAQTHNVYLGTSEEEVRSADAIDPRGVLMSEGQAETTFDPGRLTLGGTYYWRIDEVNGAPDYTVNKGAVWRFTVEPFSYALSPAAISVTASSQSLDLMGPENTINGSGLNDLDQHDTDAGNAWLSSTTDAERWIQYAFDRPYVLDQMWVWNQNQTFEPFIGLGARTVTVETSLDGVDWIALADVPEFSRGTGADDYVSNTTVAFASVQAQYVRLTVNDNWGVLQPAGLSEVRFFHIPVSARNPQPAVGTTTESLEVVLGWRPGRQADVHQVLLSADRDAVMDGSAAIANTSDPWLDLSGQDLQYDTTYYWRIDEVGGLNSSVHEGVIWWFTTPDADGQ